MVDELPDGAVESASLLIRRVLIDDIDPDQAWVWTAEWQRHLRDSLADLDAGRTARFDDGEDFLEALQ
ncbi:MAG: hypothetical protein DCC49_02135 [Acidobacteria bacterium]|nr:MAG: hypothetical protein DCC49_02135 [Acidobacteriota bacterium]